MSSVGRGTIIRTYDYRDASGALLFQVCRFEPKDFRQRRPDGRGGWLWNLRGVTRVPYRLPDVVRTAQAGEVVWIVEGEKDADALATLGLTATCNVGGAGKWQAAYANWLRGAHVVILPDNDEPGLAHGQQVARSLTGVVRSIKIVELPGLKPKGDVSDWLQQHDVQALFAVVRQAPIWTPLGHVEQLSASPMAATKRSRRHPLARYREARIRSVPITRIAEVLGLGKPEGNGTEVRVRCPFHDDEHPSLSLNDEKNVWYCHVCAEGGGALELYTRIKGVAVADAVRDLTQ